jgi:hypothetical protein
MGQSERLTGGCKFCADLEDESEELDQKYDHLAEMGTTAHLPRSLKASSKPSVSGSFGPVTELREASSSIERTDRYCFHNTRGIVSSLPQALLGCRLQDLHRRNLLVYLKE